MKITTIIAALNRIIFVVSGSRRSSTCTSCAKGDAGTFMGIFSGRICTTKCFEVGGLSKSC